MIMQKNVSRITVLVLHVAGMLYSVDGHGYLKSPPQRSSAWRYGYSNPVNYDDNQLFCGGVKRQWETNDGMCGVCGDPYDGVKLNEAGNQTNYANGVITGNYMKGSLMDITVKITTNHKGWFEFRLCANNNPLVPVTQACLNRTLLPITNHGTRFNLTSAPPREYNMKLQLPAEVTCTQCVLQWRYYTGNSWGCEASGCCVGCGKQETFVNCADIAIHDTTTASTSPLTSTAQSASTTTTTTTQAPSSNTSSPASTTTQASSPTTTTTAQTTSATTPIPTSSTTQTTQEASSTTTPSSPLACTAVGIWATVPGIQKWCENNCNHAPPYCPSTHCHCEIYR